MRLEREGTLSHGTAMIVSHAAGLEIAREILHQMGKVLNKFGGNCLRVRLKLANSHTLQAARESVNPIVEKEKELLRVSCSRLDSFPFFHQIAQSTQISMKPIFLLITASLLFPLSSFAADSKPPKGFTALFDGESLEGWNFIPSEIEPVWKADKKNGTLRRVARNGAIWTNDAYSDFVLDLEFRMSRNCNSGIFVRSDPKNPVQGGFEIQIYDSFAKETIDSHDCGALYDAVVPSANVAKPAGEWNHIRVRCKGAMIQVTLNGERIVNANLDKWTTPKMNPDGSKNKFKTALKDLPRTGHIGFQDHGHNVWFRNVYLKKL